MFIKKLFLLLVVMLCWGCYHQCKSRRFVADDPWIKIAENWEVGFSVFNWDPCENGDYFECATVFHLEQNFLDKDSLKNMSIHIDSLYLEVGDRVYKRINENKNFDRAIRANENNPPYLQLYINSLSIVSRDSVKTGKEWPLIPRKIKKVIATAYVSFKYPDDDRVESMMIKKELHEKNESVYVEGSMMH